MDVVAVCEQHALNCIHQIACVELHALKPYYLAGSAPGSWTYVDTKRPHTHDVRMLVLVQRPSAPPLLMSGGNDAQLIAYDANAFLKVCRSVWLSPSPHTPSLS